MRGKGACLRQTQKPWPIEAGARAVVVGNQSFGEIRPRCVRATCLISEFRVIGSKVQGLEPIVESLR